MQACGGIIFMRILGAARGGDEIYTWMSGCDASLHPCHSRQGLVNRVMRKVGADSSQMWRRCNLCFNELM
jgi:hypothetical protein